MIPLPPEHIVDLIAFGLSFLLYVAVIYTILKDHRMLKSTFFLLSAAHAGPDIVFYLVVHIFRARKYSFIPGFFENLPKSIPKVLFLVKFHLKYAQLFGIVMFAINRYSVFVPGCTFDKWWTTKGIIRLQILQWTLPVWVWFPGYLQDFNVSYVVLPDSPAVRQVTDPELYLMYFTIEAVGTTAAAVASTVFYYLAIKKVTEHARNVNTFKAEYRLFISGLIVCVLLLLDTIYCVAVVIFQAVGDFVTVKMFDNCWYLLTDCLCMAQPWILIGASQTLRERVFHRFFGYTAQWLPKYSNNAHIFCCTYRHEMGSQTTEEI